MKIAGKTPQIALTRLETLWVNTGTLCNIACVNCFMDSSPANDSLAYFTLANFRAMLEGAPHSLREVGFTGGEPFMNPDIIPMLETALTAGKQVLVLTNAMRPMQRHEVALTRLIADYPVQLTVRVSLDHYEAQRHEALRGEGSFAPAMAGLQFLVAAGAKTTVAARTPWGECETLLRAGFGRLFAAHEVKLNAECPADLVLFPEMNAAACTPVVTLAALAAIAPEKPLMCMNSRMVVQRQGEEFARFTPCTVLPGRDLAAFNEPVTLDHPHCTQFCVQGGASCSG